MKFKVLVAGLLTAILAVNMFMAYTVIQEEKKQTNALDTLVWAKIEELSYTNFDLSDGLRNYYTNK